MCNMVSRIGRNLAMRPSHWKAILETRSKLFEYIDALWTGRLTAPRSLSELYTERLATAAKFASLLRHVRSAAEIRRLIRDENDRFSRELLATDEGRRARSAFNLFARDATALKDYQLPDGSVPTGLESLVGEQVSSVSFRLDAIVLEFNGQALTVDGPISIEIIDRTLHLGDVEFADRMRSLLGATVQSIEVGRPTIIAFDRLRLEIAGSEGPLLFTNRDGQTHAIE